MNEKEYKKVLFFRKGKNHYFKYDDIILKVSASSIDQLKGILTLPYFVEFIGYSRADMSRIITDLHHASEKVLGKRIDNGQENQAMHFIIRFSKKEHNKKTMKSTSNHSKVYEKMKEVKKHERIY